MVLKRYEINNLEDVINSYLHTKKNVLNYNTSRLTASGENFGSLMLAVELKTKNREDENEEEILHLVAKMLPPNAWLQKVFKVQITFPREMNFYLEIVPAIKQFQKEQSVGGFSDFTPKCFGGRCNLDFKNDYVDGDGVILLENLKLSGYGGADPTVGFDLKTSEFILRDLAEFHAVPLAMKLQDPKLFKKKVLPFLATLSVFETIPLQQMTDFITDIIKTHEECVPLLPRVTRGLEMCLKEYQNRSEAREPFATINHNDFWVNNTMLKYEEGELVSNKMVDFQIIDYGSPAKDLIFFLFSSVQPLVLEEHYDHLVRCYFEHFVAVLEKFKCDTSEFTFDLLEKEIEISAKTTEFFHVILMLRTIFSHKGTVVDIEEVDQDYIFSHHATTENYKKRVVEIVLLFAERNWI